MRYKAVLKASVLVALMLILAGCAGAGEASLTETVSAPSEEVPAEPLNTPTPTRAPVSLDVLSQTPEPAFAAQSALNDVRARGELRVGVLYNAPPLSFLSDNGEVSGYEPDLIRKIAEWWEIDVSFVQVTKQTRLPMLMNGDVDMIAGTVPHRRDHEALVEFSDTVFHSGYAVLVSEVSGLDLSGAIGSGTTAVVGQGAEEATVARAAELGVIPSVLRFDTLDEALAALEGDLAHAVVARQEHLMPVAGADDGLVLLDDMVLEEPYAFAFRRGDVGLRDLVNLTIQEIVFANELTAIYADSFTGYVPDLVPPRPGEPAFTFEAFPADVAGADSVIARLRSGEALRVAGLDLSPEPVRFDSQPIYDGYSRAVINEMARRWGVLVTEIPETEGQAGLDLLAAGQADIVAGIRAERTLYGQVGFSPAYYYQGIRIAHMSDVGIRTLFGLTFQNVGAIDPLDISQDLVEDNVDSAVVRPYENLTDAFNTLIGRSVTALVGDEYILSLMNQADARIEVEEDLYRPREYVFAMSRLDPDFQALVAFTLQDMAADGTLDRLQEQYFLPYVPEGVELEPVEMERWPGDGSLFNISD